MALSRNAKTASRIYPKLGGLSFVDIVPVVVNLAKGRIAGKKWDWFYQSFIRKEMPDRLPDTVEKVRERLASAWWVEEDDIVQEIYLYLWRVNPQVPNLIGVICRYIRDWLLKQRVFQRSSMGEEGHSQILESGMNVGRGVLELPPRNLFDKYLMHLTHSLELSRQEIGAILQIDVRQVNRHQQRIYKQLEEQDDWQ